MTSFDTKKAFYSKSFHRFTGSPENWLTAIKYMTWGLEEKYRDRWERIMPGDVFLMHSTTKSLYKNARSSIVGIGVVGGEKKRKDNFLWIQEIKSQQNIWPLLVPFSEVYLFSQVPSIGGWEAPGIAADSAIQNLIDRLLSGAVPVRALGEGKGSFPVMGTISSVRPQLTDRLFSIAQPSLYSEFYTESSAIPMEFMQLKDAESTLHYVPTLKFLEGSVIKARKQTQEKTHFERDNALLEKAEKEHMRILQAATDFFTERGFATWYNPHVDLLAESKSQSFLVEVKSTLTKNFRKQARHGVGQLFEYEYFDVRQHYKDKPDSPSVAKILMPSDNPGDKEYTSFLNTLKIHLAWPVGTHLKATGDINALSTLLV